MVSEAGSQDMQGIHYFINKSFQVKMPWDWRQFGKTRIAIGNTQQQTHYWLKPSTILFAKMFLSETHPRPQGKQASHRQEHSTRMGTLAAEPSACFSLQSQRATLTPGTEGAWMTRWWKHWNTADRWVAVCWRPSLWDGGNGKIKRYLGEKECAAFLLIFFF